MKNKMNILKRLSKIVILPILIILLVLFSFIYLTFIGVIVWVFTGDYKIDNARDISFKYIPIDKIIEW